MTVTFLVGVAAAVVVLVGKFTFENDSAMYAGLAILIAASVWNSWPRQPAVTTCSSCGGSEEPVITLRAE
jgi:hypothetical protein